MKDLPVFKSAEGRAAVLAAEEAAFALVPPGALGGRPLERLRVPTTAGETAVFAFGAAAAGATPVLLIHGTMSNSSMWLGYAEALGRDRLAYAVDIPGEPGLSEDRRLEWSGPEAAAWLAEVVAGLGLGDHAVVGLSLGGWIGLSYAIGRPEGLRALALLCPSGIGRARPSFILKAFVAMARGRRGLEALSRSLYGDISPPEEAIRAEKLFMESTNARMETPRIFSDGELAGIRSPLFLGVGTKDILLRSQESARRIGQLRPDAEVLVLPGAGHALMGLGERVAEFLRGK
jgi:pimeloyl-ACP methyl ester carboxylesterase